MAITVSGYNRTVAVAVIPGGAAGAHTIQGDLDAANDDLVSVVEDAAGVLTDRTVEFSVTGYNTIDNTAGTDTTGDFLIVTYLKAAGE